MSLLILVVDDEPDVELLFRQQFRRDLRAGRFDMEFAQSAPAALQRITDAAGVSLILILSDINMPGMSGLELLPKAKAARPDVPVIMITAYGDPTPNARQWRAVQRRFSQSRSISGRSAVKSICALNWRRNCASYAAVGRFSNRPSGVKHFQTVHHCNVDVTHGLALLFEIGTKVLPALDPRTRRNNLSGGLAVRLTAVPVPSRRDNLVVSIVEARTCPTRTHRQPETRRGEPPWRRLRSRRAEPNRNLCGVKNLTRGVARISARNFGGARGRRPGGRSVASPFVAAIDHLSCGEARDHPDTNAVLSRIPNT